jgi:hypothetical protein
MASRSVVIDDEDGEITDEKPKRKTKIAKRKPARKVQPFFPKRP